jgi:transcriptional regulator with XRE-family HTH domain
MAKEFEPREFKIRDPEKLTLHDVVTPIFDLAMGQRLATARMQKGWRREDCAPKLGLNATTLGRLEAGELAVPRHPFSVSKLEDVFGELGAKYIILDRYGATYDQYRIADKFWSKVRRNRKPRPRSQQAINEGIRKGPGGARPGETYNGIPAEIWDQAWALHLAAKKKRSK